MVLDLGSGCGEQAGQSARLKERLGVIMLRCHWCHKAGQESWLCLSNKRVAVFCNGIGRCLILAFLENSLKWRFV